MSGLQNRVSRWGNGRNNEAVNGGGIFFMAASYKFSLEDVICSVEPKICYRGIRGYDNILDVGVNVSFLDNVANVMTVYHTSESLTTGIGVNILKTVPYRHCLPHKRGELKAIQVVLMK